MEERAFGSIFSFHNPAVGLKGSCGFYVQYLRKTSSFVRGSGTIEVVNYYCGLQSVVAYVCYAPLEALGRNNPDDKENRACANNVSSLLDSYIEILVFLLCEVPLGPQTSRSFSFSILQRSAGAVHQPCDDHQNNRDAPMIASQGENARNDEWAVASLHQVQQRKPEYDCVGQSGGAIAFLIAATHQCTVTAVRRVSGVLQPMLPFKGKVLLELWRECNVVGSGNAVHRNSSAGGKGSVYALALDLVHRKYFCRLLGG